MSAGDLSVFSLNSKEIFSFKFLTKPFNIFFAQNNLFKILPHFEKSSILENYKIEINMSE
jgi:hypothetical protein